MANVHHANILVSRGNCKEFLRRLLEEELHFHIARNPDFLAVEYDVFGVNDARYLEHWSLSKPFNGKIKVAFIVADSLTFEAQNALLKTIEEPIASTYFFVNLPSLGGILPTFLSRVNVLEVDVENLRDLKSCDDFLRGDIKKRLSLVRSILEKNNKEDIRRFLGDLEHTARNGGLNPLGAKNILIAKVFAATRGSSSRILLEWLACVL